jgi:hypothetical protein
MIMGKIIMLVFSALLIGCQTAGSTNEASAWFKIKPGSKLVLDQPLDIPSGKAHILLQKGQVSSGVDNYTVNCSFEVRNLGPENVRPDTFLITDASDSQEWVSQPAIMRFYKVLRLKSERQPDVLKMVCQDWDGPLMGTSITVDEIKQAVGNYISFEFAE